MGILYWLYLILIITALFCIPLRAIQRRKIWKEIFDEKKKLDDNLNKLNEILTDNKSTH